MFTCVALDGTISPLIGTRPGVLAVDPCWVIDRVQVVPAIDFLACARRTSAVLTVRVHFPTSSVGGGAAEAVATTTSAASTAPSKIFMPPTLDPAGRGPVMPAG